MAWAMAYCHAGYGKVKLPALSDIHAETVSQEGSEAVFLAWMTTAPLRVQDLEIGTIFPRIFCPLDPSSLLVPSSAGGIRMSMTMSNFCNIGAAGSKSAR